jgi:hypothetical protein
MAAPPPPPHVASGAPAGGTPAAWYDGQIQADSSLADIKTKSSMWLS